MNYLHVDLIVEALIGPEDTVVERFIQQAESGEVVVILELALFYALCCVRPEDRVNLPRFTRLLRCVKIQPSPKPFDWPQASEVEHWRAVALGQEE